MNLNPPTPSAPEAAAEDNRPRIGRAADVHAVLLEEIETGRLPPGAPLDERALAARFSVSRTPVREALQQLAVRGWVRIAPRQGITVARLSVSRLRAILEFIAEAEAMVARLAARRVDDDLRRQLDAALERGQQAAAAQGGSAEYVLANALFHETLYSGCRNVYLAEQIRAARRLIQRYRVRDFHSQVQVNRSLQDHLMIARAVQSGDEAIAAQAMLAHLPIGTTGFSEFLATVPAGFFDNEAGE